MQTILAFTQVTFIPDAILRFVNYLGSSWIKKLTIDQGMSAASSLSWLIQLSLHEESRISFVFSVGTLKNEHLKNIMRDLFANI